MEKSYIKNMDIHYVSSIGFSEEQIQFIFKLVNRGIQEKLYVNSHVPYHNLKHIERVLCYCMWILNQKKNNGEILENQDILFYSALYHDCGRSLLVSNKMHGIVGAQIAKEKLKDTFDSKKVIGICLLIETHASRVDEVDFKNITFSKEEKENIQILSNILKDADALDRNRIKLFKFAQCNPNFLKTKEAKEIYLQSDTFYLKYQDATHQVRLLENKK